MAVSVGLSQMLVRVTKAARAKTCFYYTKHAPAYAISLYNRILSLPVWSRDPVHALYGTMTRLAPRLPRPLAAINHIAVLPARFALARPRLDSLFPRLIPLRYEFYHLEYHENMLRHQFNPPISG